MNRPLPTSEYAGQNELMSCLRAFWYEKLGVILTPSVGCTNRARRAAMVFARLALRSTTPSVVGVETECAHLNGRLVDIDARRAGAAGRGNSTDGDRVGA